MLLFICIIGLFKRDSSLSLKDTCNQVVVHSTDPAGSKRVDKVTHHPASNAAMNSGL